MYLLNAEFARKQGSKDKQKRKSRKGLLGATSGLLLGTSIAAGTNKQAISKQLTKQRLDTKGIKQQISNEVKDNANLYKNVMSPSRKFIEDLNSTAPTGNLEDDLRRQIKVKTENLKNAKSLGKTTDNNRKIIRNTLKTQASNLKKTVGKNRLVTGALLGIGSGALVGKSIDLVKYIQNPNIIHKNKIKTKK